MSLLDYLLEQSKNPKGTIGTLMINIMNTVHNQRTKWALNNIYIKEDSIILDIGCGGGKTINTLSKIIKDGKIYGIDYSKDSVETSIRKNQKYVDLGKIEIIQASVSSIPFSEEYFDVITAIQTHYFWPNLENDLREVYRVLKQKGLFMIASEVYKINYHMKRYKSKEELEQLFKKIGFKEVQFHEKNGWICAIGIK